MLPWSKTWHHSGQLASQCWESPSTPLTVLANSQSHRSKPTMMHHSNPGMMRASDSGMMSRSRPGAMHRSIPKVTTEAMKFIGFRQAADPLLERVD